MKKKPTKSDKPVTLDDLGLHTRVVFEAVRDGTLDKLTISPQQRGAALATLSRRDLIARSEGKWIVGVGGRIMLREAEARHAAEQSKPKAAKAAKPVNVTPATKDGAFYPAGDLSYAEKGKAKPKAPAKPKSAKEWGPDTDRTRGYIVAIRTAMPNLKQTDEFLAELVWRYGTAEKAVARARKEFA